MPITPWDLAHKQCFLTREQLKFKIIKLDVKVASARTWSDAWWHYVGELNVLVSQRIVVQAMMESLEKIIGLQPYDPQYFQKDVFGPKAPLLTNEVKK